MATQAVTNAIKLVSGKKNTYPETTVRLRSDEEFVVMAGEGHHFNPSPLTGIVKMVFQFPIDHM